MTHTTIWAPWRIDYIRGLDESAPDIEDSTGCFLCDAGRADLPGEDREKLLVLASDERGVLLMNRYPYTNGHLLAAPREHLADLDEMTPDQRAGLMELAALGQRALKQTMNPQGINLGMNLGRCAGAGLPGHAHLHIVPRWSGDVNFMEVVGQVRVIPEALQRSYKQLKDAIDSA
ncbi:MAG: HIT family protein [Phycisphaeraceae bacterium]